MESIASILLIGTLINRLIDKGILSPEDRRIILSESLSIVSEVEATNPDQAALIGKVTDYLRHFGAEERPQS